MTDIVNVDKLYSRVKPLIPINFRYVNSVYLVGSFANPNKEIDRDGKISDIDIFMNINDDADSISCIKGKYGSINIETNNGLFEDRPIQFLTSRQPNVFIDSFDYSIELYNDI